MIIQKKIGVISLGCDKNRVDTEKLLAKLNERHILVNDENEAEIIIINTCAFLESSRKEALAEIFRASELRENKLEKLIVTGCLPQKFVGEIFNELTEADAFLGVSDYQNILEIIDGLYENDNVRINAVTEPKNEKGIDRVLTTKNYAYLKIADGCSNHCTYCLIPKIRGKYRSVETKDLIEEVKGLGQVNELILVAQDITKYGEDLQPKTSLTELLWKLVALQNVKGIRLLYCYPENITDELIKMMREHAKIIRYIDIPLQHADDRVLKRMNRKGTGEQYLALIEKLKREVPNIAIRSTFITGFPGEDQQAFENLLEFIKKAKLFNAGFFKYSREEDTPAYNLDNQVMEGEKTKRLKKLYSAQKKVVRENLKQMKGKTYFVTAEGFDDSLTMYYGRSYFNAPDIDGKVYFFSADEVEYGKTYRIKILNYSGYDLYGEREL